MRVYPPWKTEQCMKRMRNGSEENDQHAFFNVISMFLKCVFCILGMFYLKKGFYIQESKSLKFTTFDQLTFKRTLYIFSISTYKVLLVVFPLRTLKIVSILT